MTFAAPGFAARLSNALEAWSSWSVTEHRCGVSHPLVVIATCRLDFRDRPAVDSASGAARASSHGIRVFQACRARTSPPADAAKRALVDPA
ncbi:MAG TPA: hypothetical protein VHC92_04660 [Rhodanobacteraceae bacterium]|nr:hypothetical protein [Rhodanobacteraceae bacterium]